MGRCPRSKKRGKESPFKTSPPTIVGATTTDREKLAFGSLRVVLKRGHQIESYISNPRRGRDAKFRVTEDTNTLRRIRRASAKTAQRCLIVRSEIEKKKLEEGEQNLSHGGDLHRPCLSPNQLTEFTSPYPLQAYEKIQRYIPRIVNVVSVAIARPIPGRGTTLPLSNEAFHMIATCCTGAYYAPRRFSNIQLGFRQPRARVLVFQTGQLVTTGTSGISSTRLVVNLAIEQLAREAGIHLQVEQFAVKNIVASCSLSATFNCDGFSKENSAETNYDRSSFAGMTWRPAEFTPGCVEIYSTGNANIPGTKSHATLLSGFGKLVPRLLQYSSSALDNDKDDVNLEVAGQHTAIEDSLVDEALMSDNDDDLWEGWAERE